MKLEHVKGHSGNTGNDGADRMAVWGAYGRDMGADLNGEEETPHMRRAITVARKKRDIAEKRERNEMEAEVRETRRLLVKAQLQKERLKRKRMDNVLDGADKLARYCQDRDEARSNGALAQRIQTSTNANGADGQDTRSQRQACAPCTRATWGNYRPVTTESWQQNSG